ncbi:MAG: tetratricopeptide repeat protein [Candidatus Eremiobacteraeota bacterium]|nr:tetratricopeptide repeat protein [Candidatus Eremiobacteraeota bacterium]
MKDSGIAGHSAAEVAYAKCAEGEALALRHDYVQAVAILKDALALLLAAPADERSAVATVRAYNSLGFATFYQGALDEAIDFYREGLSFAETRHVDLPYRHAITVSLVSALSRSARDAEAVTYLEALQRCEDETHATPVVARVQTLFTLGLLHDRLNDPDRSSECYGKVIALVESPPPSPEYVEALARLGDAQERIGDQETAIQSYLRCIKVAKASGLAKVYGARAALRLKMIAQPSDDFVPAADSFLVDYMTDVDADIEVLAQIAADLYERKDVVAAKSVYQRAMFLSSERNEPANLAENGIALSELLEGEGQLTAARDVLLDVRRRSNVGSRALDQIPQLLRNLARLAAKLQDQTGEESAIAQLETVDCPSEEIRRDQLTRAFNDIGSVLIGANAYDRAVLVLQRGLAVHNSSPNADLTLIGHIHYNLGLANKELSRHDQALREYRQAQYVYNIAGAEADAADAIAAEAAVLYLLGDYDGAVPVLRREVERRSEMAGSKPTADLIDAIVRLANMFDTLGRERDHEATYVDFLRKVPDPNGERPADWPYALIGLALNNLGYIYFLQQRYAEARPLFEKSLRNHELAPEESVLKAYTLESIGELCVAEKDLPAARAAYEKAIDLRRRLGATNDVDLARALRDLAMIFEQQNELEKAKEMAAACYSVFKSSPNGGPFEIAKVIELSANIAERLGENATKDQLLDDVVSLRDSVEEVQPTPESRADGGAHRKSLTAAPSTGFLTRDEVVRIVLASPQADGTTDIRGVVLLFETLKQHTWLVGTPDKLFCLLDDENQRIRNRAIQWVQAAASVKTVEAKPYKTKTGLVNIGRKQNWLYSIRLHPDPVKLRRDILELVGRSS